MRLTRFALPLIAVVTLNADEGLWPYNQFPQDALKTKNGFDTPPGFLDHLRLSSVRIGGGSGAFVSVDGLILTSRQGAAGCSVPVDGFVSATRAAELRCPTLDAGVLLNIEDVSAQLKTTGQSLTQRNAAVQKIERDCAAKTGNVCSVVRFFAAAATISTDTSAMPMSGWFSPPNIPPHFSAENATASPISVTA